jgi:divalent metal cation (Fe/Co/Zn/Cd) transporter
VKPIIPHSFYIKIYKLHKEDIYLLAGTIGFFTTVIYLVADYLSSLIFKANPIPLYSSQLVLSRTSDWDFLYGIAADLIAGTFLGAITAFVLERTNYKNIIQKGFIAGGVLWIMHVSVIPKIWDPELLKLVNPATGHLSFFTHVFWGIFYGFILTRFVQEINKSNSVNHKLR